MTVIADHTEDTHVSETDAFALRMERDPLLRSTIVAVAVLDRAPRWDDLVRRVDRATRLATAFRQKLVDTPLRLAPPRWVDDPDFDLSWHMRRIQVPAGGGLPAVVEFARTTGMTAFDPERPLWEFTVVEGLPDGRAALVMKVHHALTDGIGGIQVAAHVVDLEREPAEPTTPAEPAAPPVRSGSWIGDVTEALGHDLRALTRLGGALVRDVPSAVGAVARDPLGTAGEIATTMGSVARFVRPVTSTRSPVMTNRRLQWHYDVFEVPLAPMKAAAATVDGTLNDAFVAAVCAGFRRYHDRHGTSVAELRMTMPISVRTEAHGMGGNHITLVRFEIPVGLSDPAERMRQVGRAVRAQRQEPAIAYSDQIAGVLNLLPAWITGGMLKHVDLLASNVPGFDAEVFVAGARVDAFYAFGPTTGAAANVTLMSYGDTCFIGLNTDAGAVPDPDVLLDCLRAGFDEIVAVRPGPSAS